MLVCGLCPLAQVTRQNPVDGLEQADSKISLRVEHSAVFCSSSNKHKHITYTIHEAAKKRVDVIEAPKCVLILRREIFLINLPKAELNKKYYVLVEV